MNCVKTAEPIEMPFGLWTRVGPRNHVLDHGSITPGEGAISWGGGHVPPHSKVQGENTVSCRETVDEIEMPFGLLTPVTQRTTC